jgi:EF hand
MDYQVWSWINSGTAMAAKIPPQPGWESSQTPLPMKISWFSGNLPCWQHVDVVACGFAGRGASGAFDMEKPVKELVFAVVLGVVCAVSQTFAAGKATGSLQTLDSDRDGTVDLNETKTAASAVFDRLDRDHDGTLDKRELKGRLSAKELAAEDGDHDGTLTKDEYLATVEKRFKAANPDGDDKLDAKELSSRPGRALQRLVR